MSVRAVTPKTPKADDRRFFAFNAVVSVAALATLAWLLLLRRGGDGSLDLSYMPTVDAGLNATATALLCAGWIAIKNRRPDVHKYFMVSAFAASSLFLVGYLAYHYAHGDTHYEGTGALRVVYFVVLISHVLLSMAVVPLVLTSFFFAWKKRFDRHRRIAKITLPIWLYVSVTGVVIYFMLY